MSNYWKDFFESYRMVDVKCDSDLRFQVGKSVGGKAISDKEFNRVVDRIINILDLKPDDHVLDLCCGNGIITNELAKHCSSVMGIDFSAPYIDNAKQFKSAPNINYVCDDVENFPAIIKKAKFIPTKVLMQGSLPYLSPSQFSGILGSLKVEAPALKYFLVSSVPDIERRNIFHNTIKRKLTWLFYSVVLNKDQGIGRWWSRKEINGICDSNRFKASFDQPVSDHQYRMDFVVSPVTEKTL